MNVVVNCAPWEVPEGSLLLEVLDRAGLHDLRGVAVALDGEVIPRSQWAPVHVRDGQQVEDVLIVDRDEEIAAPTTP